DGPPGRVPHVLTHHRAERVTRLGMTSADRVAGREGDTSAGGQHEWRRLRWSGLLYRMFLLGGGLRGLSRPRGDVLQGRGTFGRREGQVARRGVGRLARLLTPHTSDQRQRRDGGNGHTRTPAHGNPTTTRHPTAEKSSPTAHNLDSHRMRLRRRTYNTA